MDNVFSRSAKLPFEEVVNKITQNLQQQGFGIITTVDVRDILKQKLNIEFRNYKILGACNPEFAYEAISLESHIGVMLPCNIVVQEHENGEVEVSAMSPLKTIEKIFSISPLTDLAGKINGRLEMAIDGLRSGTYKSSHTEGPLREIPKEDLLPPIQG